MLLNEDRNDEGYQTYMHPALDLAFVKPAPTPRMPTSTVDVGARIYLPEIRVRSAVVLCFEADDPGQQSSVDLRAIGNEVVGYACLKARSMVIPVGEIWGKHGVPLAFPKSKIAGIKLETQEWAQWIDVVAKLGNPQIDGRWSLYYHATSDNKLKPREWQAYISRVTAEVMGGGDRTMYYNPPG